MTFFPRYSIEGLLVYENRDRAIDISPKEGTPARDIKLNPSRWGRDGSEASSTAIEPPARDLPIFTCSYCHGYCGCLSCGLWPHLGASGDKYPAY